jgi:molecular chaperone GrpE (heat shock protein)
MADAKDSISQDNQSLSENEKAEDLTRAFQAFLMTPFQKVSLKIEGLMEELENRDDRVNKLEERITSAEKQMETIPVSQQERIEKVEKFQSELEDRVRELETKFDEILSHLKRIESHLSPVKAEREIVPKEAVLDIQGLIEQARAKERENLKDDKNSIELSLKSAGFWLERGERLKLMIKEAADSADEVIAKSNTILEDLPEELETALRSSQQGLNIIGRMLQGSVNQGDRLESLVEKIDLEDNLQELEEDEWIEILKGETNEKSAQEKINKKLDVIGRSNYKLVSKAVELASKKQKIWLDFVEKQVLPILDGINDGKNHTSILIDELAEQYQESEPKLSGWFNTYVTLSSNILTMLNDIGVYRMDIEPGMMIDFERHEPSSVEADPEMENEQIKEISRDGYEYADHKGDQQTLRVARVVVVKNDD